MKLGSHLIYLTIIALIVLFDTCRWHAGRKADRIILPPPPLPNIGTTISRQSFPDGLRTARSLFAPVSNPTNRLPTGTGSELAATLEKRDKAAIKKDFEAEFRQSWFKPINWDKVRKLLAEEPSLLNELVAGSTLLHLASRKGDRAGVEWLLAQGADVNIKDGAGGQPLFDAKNKAVAELLLSHSADVNARNDNGTTPLLQVLQTRGTESERVAQLLIEHGADVNVTDNDGKTIVWTLANGLHKDWLEYCLQQGADPNARSRNGYGLWQAAILNRRIDIITLLAQYGTEFSPDDVALVKTTLESSNMYMLERLITAGMDINRPDGNGLTPLDYAVRNGNMEMFYLLQSYGAQMSGTAKKIRDSSFMLEGAINMESSQIVQYLLEQGADVNGKINGAIAIGNLTFSNYTPLINAVSGDKQEIVSLLLDKGADVNARTKEGFTALTIAEKLNHTELVDLLLAHGATK